MQQHQPSQPQRSSKRRRSGFCWNLRYLALGLTCVLALLPMALHRVRHPSRHGHPRFVAHPFGEGDFVAADHLRFNRDAWRSLAIPTVGSANVTTLFRYFNERARLQKSADDAYDADNRATLHRMALGDWRDGRWPAFRDRGCVGLRLLDAGASRVEVRFTCESDDFGRVNFDAAESSIASQRWMWPSAWFYPLLCAFRAFHRFELLQKSLPTHGVVVAVCTTSVEHLEIDALVAFATQRVEWVRNQTVVSCDWLPLPPAPLDVESFPTSSVVFATVPQARASLRSAGSHVVFLLGEVHSEQVARSLIEAVLVARFQWSDVCGPGDVPLSCAAAATEANAKDNNNGNGMRGADILCRCLSTSSRDAMVDDVANTSFEWLRPWVHLATQNVVFLTVSVEHSLLLTLSLRISHRCWDPSHREVLREVTELHNAIAPSRSVIAVVAVSYCALPLLCQKRIESEAQVAVEYESVVFLPPPAFPQFERSAMEQAVAECSVLLGRQPPVVTWYRPHEDTEPPTPRAIIERHPWNLVWMAAGYYRTNVQTPPSNLPSKDAAELALEAMLASAALHKSIDDVAAESHHSSIPSPRDAAPRVQRILGRTLYDPDFVILKPHHSWILASASPEVVSRVLPCPPSPLFSTPPLGSESGNLVLGRQRGYSDLEWALVASEEDVSTVATLDHLRALANATPISPLPRGASSNSARRRRKRQLLLGNMSLARLAWHTENRDPLVDLALVAFPLVGVNCLSGVEPVMDDHIRAAVPWTTYFHYPWVRDNLYHLHNDNLLPLLLAIARVEQRDGQSPNHCRRLVLLPSHRKRTPLPFAGRLFALLFDEVVELGAVHHENRTAMEAARVTPGARRGGPPSCLVDDSSRSTFHNGTLHLRGDIVWGRPRRPFSSVMRDVVPYARHEVVSRWRQVVYAEAASAAANASQAFGDGAGMAGCGFDSDIPCVITATWLSRKGERALQSEGALLAWIQATTSESLRARYGCQFCELRLRVCCEGMSYWEQVELMRGTDLLLGVHGAGLLHVIHLDPRGRGIVFSDRPRTVRRRTPLVVHIGSVFLDFHEQTIISRLVSLSRSGPGVGVVNNSGIEARSSLRYFSTATEPTVRDLGSTWRSPFSLTADDLKGVWHHALWTFFLGD